MCRQQLVLTYAAPLGPSDVKTQPHLQVFLQVSLDPVSSFLVKFDDGNREIRKKSMILFKYLQTGAISVDFLFNDTTNYIEEEEYFYKVPTTLEEN